MLYPGKKDEGNTNEELAGQAEELLAVDLPTLKHICEPKSIIMDNAPAFVAMAELKRSCIKSYEVNQLGNSTAEEVKENLGLEEETSHVLQILHSPGSSNDNELAVKSSTLVAEPIPFAMWDRDNMESWSKGTEAKHQMKLLFAQNKNGDVCYVTALDSQKLSVKLISNNTSTGNQVEMQEM